jgi:hypothetical protein
MNTISDILMRTQEHVVFQCFNNLCSIGRAEHGESEEEYEEIDYDPEYDQAPRHTQDDPSQTDNDHESTEDDHESTEDNHESTENDHGSTEDDPGLSRQTSLQFSNFVYLVVPDFYFFYLQLQESIIILQ